MSLNIKNPEAHALAARLAKKTGETLTEAVDKGAARATGALEINPDFDEALYQKLRAIAAGLPQAHEGALPFD